MSWQMNLVFPARIHMSLLKVRLRESNAYSDDFCDHLQTG